VVTVNPEIVKVKDWSAAAPIPFDAEMVTRWDPTVLAADVPLIVAVPSW
jgi:hypothetical protein